MNTIEENSILISTKKLAGIDKNYDVFDLDIVTYINSIFMTLNQLGVGPKEVFSITNEETTWDEFEEGHKDLRACRAYIAKKVRMEFDPPTSATLADAINKSIAEFEWRLNCQVETMRKLNERR